MSLGTFFEQAQRYFNKIVEVQDSLSYAYKLFGRRDRNIWPDQCERAAAIIESLSEPTQDLCQLLEKTAELPVAVVPFRDPLTVEIHHINEQISELMPRITEFGIICGTPSALRVKEQRDIQVKIESIVNGCSVILQKIYALLDQSRFQDRKYASPL